MNNIMEEVISTKVINTALSHYAHIQKYFSYFFRVNIIEVSPNYLPDYSVECFLTTILILMYCYLIVALKRSRREIAIPECDEKLEPSMMMVKQPEESNITDNESDIDVTTWRTRDFINDLPIGLHIRPSAKQLQRTRSYMERLIKLTPSEYVRQDRQQQLRKTDYVKSLTSLYLNITSNLFTEEELRKQVEATKEHCLLSHATHELMNYIDSSCVSESLIDLLCDIVQNESDTNVPSHLLGDLTSFLYDIGNLQEKVLYERARKPSPPSSSSSSDTSMHTAH